MHVFVCALLNKHWTLRSRKCLIKSAWGYQRHGNMSASPALTTLHKNTGFPDTVQG